MKDLPLAELVRRCRQTGAEGDRERDPYLYELLRRAIGEQDEQAWEAATVQFRGAVLANVRRHPWAANRFDDDYWINRTFERFWKAIGPDRFALFPDIPSLLAYLKTCVHSVVVTDARSFQRTPLQVPLDAAAEASRGADEVEREVLDELAMRDLWKTVNAELDDDAERLVAHLSFVLDMKPAEIQALHADRFPTIAELYRVKRSLVEKLRRSPRLRKFVE
jgi:hypothetical protein